jgi:tetratricopeptide (TPR) repeat protein
MKLNKLIVSIVVLVVLSSVLAAQSANTNWKYFLSDINRDLFDKGMKLIEDGKLSEAAESFEQVLGRKTLTFSPYFCLIGVYGQMDQHEFTLNMGKKLLYLFPKVIKELGNTSIKNPVYSQFYYTLGNAYLELSHYKEAAAAFKNVLRSNNYKRTNSFNMKKLYPTSDLEANAFYALTHLRLGIAYASMGNRDAAMKQYNILEKTDKEKAEKLLSIIER